MQWRGRRSLQRPRGPSTLTPTRGCCPILYARAHSPHRRGHKKTKKRSSPLAATQKSRVRVAPVIRTAPPSAAQGRTRKEETEKNRRLQTRLLAQLNGKEERCPWS